MKSKKRLPLLILALCLAAFAARGELITYYPPKVDLGEGGVYAWENLNGWYKTRTSYVPNTPFGSLPGPTDTVFVAHSSLKEAPLVIAGDDISVSNLYFAASDNTNVYKEKEGNDEIQGRGIKLKMASGTLALQNLHMVNLSSSPMWGVFDIAGGSVDVEEEVKLGTGGAKPEAWSSIVIGDDAEMNLAQPLHVANRLGRNGFAITNYGALAAKDLYIGSEADVSSAEGTGVVYNAGILNIQGSVVLAMNCDTVSAGYLYLKKGSEFSFGSIPGSSFSISGKKGSGILDTEIPLDVSHVAFSLGGGGEGSEAYLKLRGCASFSGLPGGKFSFPSGQKGSAYLEMYDNSSISSVSTFDCANPSKTTAGILMRDNAVISNVQVISSAPYSSRTGSSFRLDLDGNAKIVFTNSTANGNAIRAYERPGARADLRFAGMSSVENLDSVTFSSKEPGDLGGTLRLEGGTLKFRTDYTYANLSLGSSAEHTDASMVFSGYGAILRADVDTLANFRYMKFFCNFPRYVVEADGMGEKRDLDLRVFQTINEGVEYNAGGVERRWSATNKGRLLYPRASKTLCGYTSANPERTVGNYSLPGTNEQGVAIAPTVPGTFNVAFMLYGATTGDKAYLYAAQYAADRDDYPRAGTTVWRNAKILNIYRLGAASDWRDDDPETPFDNFVEMSANFCYDANLVEGDKPVNVFYCTGIGRKRWVKVGTASSPKTGLVRTRPVKPIAGEAWNLGYFAVVEGELGPDTSHNFTIVVR